MSKSSPAKGKTAAHEKMMDEGSRDMLFEGASVSQLAVLFGRNAGTVTRLIHGLRPSGERAGWPIYKIKDAAERLVPRVSDPAVIEETLRRMHFSDLPPTLSKEFWAAQRQKQIVEEQNGDLHRTADVVEVMSEAFKTCRMSLLLIPDALERAAHLTDEQRKSIQSLIDGALEELHLGLTKRFGQRPKGEANGNGIDHDDDL